MYIAKIQHTVFLLVVHLATGFCFLFGVCFLTIVKPVIFCVDGKEASLKKKKGK